VGAAAPCTHARAYTSLCARTARGFGPRTCMRRPLPLHSRGSQSVACRPLEARPILPKNAAAALSQELVNRLQALGGPILPFSIFGGDVTPDTETCASKNRRSKRARAWGPAPSRVEQQATQPLSHSTFLFSVQIVWCYRVRLRWRPRRVWAWASCSPKTLPAATTRRRGVAPTG
jgi:hypothetical protein